MKKLLFVSLLFSFVVGSISAQSTTAKFWNDTATNTTAVVQPISELGYPFYYNVNVLTDSLTGSTDGTVYLQYCAKTKSGTPAQDTANWITIATLTLNGATQQTQIWPGTASVPTYFLDGRIRVKTVGVGTQTTRIRTTISTIRKTL